MVTVKVLKRKDAASLVVAVVLALMVSAFLSQVTLDASMSLSELISGKENLTGSDSSVSWEVTYLLPTVTFLVQLIALELLIRLFIFLRGMWINAR